MKSPGNHGMQFGSPEITATAGPTTLIGGHIHI